MMSTWQVFGFILAAVISFIFIYVLYFLFGPVSYYRPTTRPTIHHLSIVGVNEQDFLVEKEKREWLECRIKLEAIHGRQAKSIDDAWERNR